MSPAHIPKQNLSRHAHQFIWIAVSTSNLLLILTLKTGILSYCAASWSDSRSQEEICHVYGSNYTPIYSINILVDNRRYVKSRT